MPEPIMASLLNRKRKKGDDDQLQYDCFDHSRNITIYNDQEEESFVLVIPHVSTCSDPQMEDNSKLSKEERIQIDDDDDTNGVTKTSNEEEEEGKADGAVGAKTGISEAINCTAIDNQERVNRTEMSSTTDNPSSSNGCDDDDVICSRPLTEGAISPSADERIGTNYQQSRLDYRLIKPPPAPRKPRAKPRSDRAHLNRHSNPIFFSPPDLDRFFSSLESAKQPPPMARSNQST